MGNRLKLFAVCLGAAALMAGCDPHVAAAPPPPAIPAEAAPVARVVANQAPDDAGQAAKTNGGNEVAATSNDANSAALAGCPVTAESLLAVLRADPDGMYGRAGRPGALVEVVCHQGFAVARTPADGVSDAVSILFRLDPGTTEWRPLNLGSADFCADVPADIAAHLPGCM